MKKGQNLTNETLRDIWPWYLLLKILKFTEKRGFQFYKFTFLVAGDQANPNLLKCKQNIKISVGIKFGKGLLTSCVMDSH